jgi:hypothetical protein
MSEWIREIERIQRARAIAYERGAISPDLPGGLAALVGFWSDIIPVVEAVERRSETVGDPEMQKLLFRVAFQIRDASRRWIFEEGEVVNVGETWSVDE